MDKDAVESYSAATDLAIRILTERLKRIFNHEPLTNGEAVAVGRAIGWLTLLTTGTDDDFMKEFRESVESVKSSKKTATKLPTKLPATASMMPSIGVPSAVPSYVATAAGRKKTRKVPMKGGGVLGKAVLGILSLFVADCRDEIGKIKVVRESALEQIRAVCPANLTDPAPPDNIMTAYYGHTPEWQKWKEVQDTYKIVCEAKRAEGAKNVTEASNNAEKAISQYEALAREHVEDAVTVGAVAGVTTGALVGSKVGAPAGPVGVGTGIIVGGLTGGVAGGLLGIRAQNEASRLLNKTVDTADFFRDEAFRYAIKDISTTYGAPLPPKGGRMRRPNRRTLRKSSQF